MVVALVVDGLLVLAGRVVLPWARTHRRRRSTPVAGVRGADA